jgi:hypothetical protein
VIVVVILDYRQSQDWDNYSLKFNAMLSFTIWMLWIRCLYFMRLSPKFSDLINLVQRVLIDILPFLGVLFVTVFAFGHAYLVISNSNDEDKLTEDGNDAKFLSNGIDAIIYVYAMCLGDFDLDDMGTEQVFIARLLFILCTIFNMIIMFNLLISIISETFNTVMSFQIEA